MNNSIDAEIVISERKVYKTLVLYGFLCCILLGLIGYFVYALLKTDGLEEVVLSVVEVSEPELLRFSETESFSTSAIEFEKATPHYLQDPMRQVDFQIPRLTGAQLSVELQSLRDKRSAGSVSDADALKKYLAHPFNVPLIQNRSITELFSDEEVPNSTALLHKVLVDVNVYTSALKRFYDRARPSAYDDGLVSAVEDSLVEPATPNRLALQLFVLAEILDDMLADVAFEVAGTESQAANAVAIRLAIRPILSELQFAGLALESDIAAADGAARLFVARLRENAQYLADLEVSRQELLTRQAE